MTALEAWPEPRPVRLTADAFFRLAEAGAFQDIGRTELIDGVIVAMNAEVADTPRGYDLVRKAAIYSRAVVPEYCVVDVTLRVIHQMWMPAGDGYSERREVAFGERIVAATMPALAIATVDL